MARVFPQRVGDHSEDYPITLLQSDNLRAGLHARPLFGKHELPAGEILVGN